MKTNESFVLRNIYGKHILMPIRTNAASNDPILLNDTAVSIWESVPMCSKPEELLDVVGNLYGLGKNSAEMTAVEHFISQMFSMGLLLDESKEEHDG